MMMYDTRDILTVLGCSNVGGNIVDVSFSLFLLFLHNLEVCDIFLF